MAENNRHFSNGGDAEQLHQPVCDVSNGSRNGIRKRIGHLADVKAALPVQTTGPRNISNGGQKWKPFDEL